MTTLDLSYEFYFNANPHYYDYTHNFHLMPDKQNPQNGQISMSKGAGQTITFDALGNYKLQTLGNSMFRLYITNLCSFNPYNHNASKQKLPDENINFKIESGTFCLLEYDSTESHLDASYRVANKRYIFDRDPLDPNNKEPSEKIFYTAFQTKTRRELITDNINFSPKGWYNFKYNLKAISSKTKQEMINECNAVLKENKLYYDLKTVSTLWEQLTDRSQKGNELHREFINKNDFGKIETINSLMQKLETPTYECYNYTIYSTTGKLLTFILLETCLSGSDKIIYAHKLSHIPENKNLIPEMFTYILQDIAYSNNYKNLAIMLPIDSDKETVDKIKTTTGLNSDIKITTPFADRIKKIFSVTDASALTLVNVK